MSSPILTRPIRRRENVLFLLYRIAIVASAEALTSFWIAFLNGHVGIAVADDLYLITFFG